MRKRLRELGFSIGRFPIGPANAITDVAGVRVGHTTLIIGEGPLEVGKGPVRTGVTAIVPNADVFENRVVAGGFVLNGAGEVSGITQVQEWGLLETPILLTNTMAVGKVSDAAVKWMTKKWPKIGGEDDVVIPLVGECDDSWLNDAVGRHVRSEHVYRAIEQASGGKVPEGSVGAGTGLITCDFKAGIGTSSRRVTIEGNDYTVGILVQSNFGVMRSLRVDGAPVGEVLEPTYAAPRRERNAGSIITVIATDTPLLSSQLVRLCKRAALGIGRTGSFAAHGSGEIMVAFSTSNRVPRQTSKMTATLEVLLDEACDPLYEAVVECTEEAIVNALCMADEMRGQSDHVAPALPLDQLSAILQRYRQAFQPAGPSGD
jgi:D-aminopeptidase